jgi:hypothetical protein
VPYPGSAGKRDTVSVMSARTRVVICVAAVAAGCGGGGGDPPRDGALDIDAITDGENLPPPPPPANAGLDYQLGGAYEPPAGVTIVSRDRTEAPAPGLYNICYVNGFQIQPGEEDMWMADHPDLILRDGDGNPVIDQDWDEMLIDVGTPDKRARVAAIVGGWIDGCATDGYQAIEIDNLDSYTRSQGLLEEEDAIAQMALFSDAAHERRLYIAQKNSAELVGRKLEMRTDFVVAEECNRYAECDVYTGAYGDQVFVIEYRQQDFTAGCAAFPDLSIVLRDRNLVTPSAAAYVFAGC